MNDYSHLRQGRTWARILLIAFTAALLLIAAKAHGAGILPLPSAPPQGWCYATTSCTAPNLCTYNGVQACPTQPPGPDLCGQEQLTDVWFTTTNHGRVDVSRYENLFGKSSALAVGQAFPAVGAADPRISALSKTGFLAAKFTVPLTISPAAGGAIGIGENSMPLYRTVALQISPSCGFARPNPLPNCTLSVKAGQRLSWKIVGSTAPGIACALTPGATYFINAKFDPPPADNTFCTYGKCPLQFNVQLKR
jgi:hypothetical protein